MTPKALIVNIPYYVPDAIPYGPAVVSGLLNDNGYDCQTWDLNIDLYDEFHKREEWELFHKNICVGWPGQHEKISDFTLEIIEWVRDQINELDHVDYIGLSVFSSQSTEFTVPVATLLRNKFPDAYIFIGGRGLDNLEKQTNEPYSEFFINRLLIDCVYEGDAENQLVECLNLGTKGIWSADPVDAQTLDSMPKANWQGYDFTKYLGYDTKEIFMPITTSKGCVRQCTFCDVANSWPKFVFRKGRDVAEELIDIYHEHGLHRIEFTDNLINGSVTNFREMNTVLAEKLPNTLEYKSYAICRGKQHSPRSDFELAAIAGAKEFKIGMESGSERVRDDMKKKFSNDDIDWFSENCEDNGIIQYWLMFVGYPTETEKEFQETLNLLERYRSSIKSGMINVWLSLPMMMTTGGGFLQKHASEYGLEHVINDPWKEHFWTSTMYKDNTFPVRANRWRRFMEKMDDINPVNKHLRQVEKFTELDGLNQIYEDYKTKKDKIIIPIYRTDFNEVNG